METKQVETKTKNEGRKLSLGPSNYFLSIVGGIILLFAAGLFYQVNLQAITLRVNNQSQVIYLHRPTVAKALLEAGIRLNPADAVNLTLEQPLVNGQTVEIRLAHPVVVDSSDNRPPQSIFTQALSPRQIYESLDIPLHPADDVYVNDILWNPDEAIPQDYLAPQKAGIFSGRQKVLRRPLPVRLSLHRAIAIRLKEDGIERQLFSTAQNVGQVLLNQNIPLYLGDEISHDLGAKLEGGLVIAIKRAKAVSIQVDNRIIHTRSLHPTVGGVLAQENISLFGQDYTLPAEDAAYEPNTDIQVIRKREVLEITETSSDFETIWLPDSNLELDREVLEQTGQRGLRKTRTRITYENGQEVTRLAEETWQDQEAAEKIIRYGTNIVVRRLDTPGGILPYWRKIRMLATSYSAATSGKSKDHPSYGITRSGLPAGFGVVAVDPAVIPLGTRLYVPGYGEAIAGDTGGAILGKHIDLGFDEDRPPLWYRWVDVYVLGSAPSSDRIRYVLPQWPQER